MSNNPSLTPDPVTSFLDPSPHHPPAGDWKDDDGDAIGSYFMHGDMGPLVEYLTQALVKSFDYKPEKNSRLIPRHVIFPDVATASYPYPSQLVLPADPARSMLVLQSTDNGFAKGVYFGENGFTALGDPDNLSANGAMWLPGKTQLVLQNYTGALHMAPSQVGSSGICSWFVLAVTA